MNNTSIWGDNPDAGLDRYFNNQESANMEGTLKEQILKRCREKRRDAAAERLGMALKEAYELNQENKQFSICELLSYLLEKENKRKIESGEMQPPYLKNFVPNR